MIQVEFKCFRIQLSYQQINQQISVIMILRRHHRQWMSFQKTYSQVKSPLFIFIDLIFVDYRTKIPFSR